MAVNVQREESSHAKGRKPKTCNLKKPPADFDVQAEGLSLSKSNESNPEEVR
jgi:hypothetical protein